MMESRVFGQLGALISLGAAVVCAACDSDAGATAEPFVAFDSVGIVITETRVPLWEERPALRWTLSDEPVFELGGVADTLLIPFYPLSSALRLGSGQLVIASGAARRIGWLTPHGDLEFVRGGAGGGPEEFRADLSTFHLLEGDSLAAMVDGERYRIAIFDLSGRRADRWLLNPEGYPQVVQTRALTWFIGARQLPGVGWIGSSYAGGITHSPVPGSSDLVRQDVALVLIRNGGVNIDTLRILNGALHSRGASGQIGGSLIFSVGSTFVPRGSEIVAGDGMKPELEILDPDGTTVGRIRWRTGDLTVTEVDRQEFLRTFRERMMERTDPPADRQSIDQRLSQFRFADRKGLFTNLHTDAEENLWVQLLGTYRGPQEFLVIDRRGRVLGEIRMPEQFQVTQFGSDFVLGIATDDLGVEYVRMYGIQKPPG
jgi:hypothetical protein